VGFEEVAGIASAHADIQVAARMEEHIVSSTWMAGEDASAVPRRNGNLGECGVQRIGGREQLLLVPEAAQRIDRRLGVRPGRVLV